MGAVRSVMLILYLLWTFLLWILPCWFKPFLIKTLTTMDVRNVMLNLYLPYILTMDSTVLVQALLDKNLDHYGRKKRDAEPLSALYSYYGFYRVGSSPS